MKLQNILRIVMKNIKSTLFPAIYFSIKLQNNRYDFIADPKLVSVSFSTETNLEE